MMQTFLYGDNKLQYLREKFNIYSSDSDTTSILNEYKIKSEYDRCALYFSKQTLQYLKFVNFLKDI